MATKCYARNATNQKLKPRGFRQKKEKLMTNQNEYKGYSLFNDVDDAELRDRNRAVIMANIVEQYTKNKKMTPKGAGLVLGYFNALPEAERKEVHERFEKRIHEMGYRYAS
jgi:hypothetical protein